MTQGVAQKKVSLGRFSKLTVPLPPRDEQAQILAILMEQTEGLSAQEQALQKAIALVAAQRQTILRAAFSGQMVPQDPADEPASRLLDRIRAARETADGKTPARRGRKAKIAA